MSLARQFKATEAPKPVNPVSKKPLIIRPPNTVVGKKRGPKPSGNAKVLLTIRVDPDVLERWKGSGKGWQSRLGEVLRANAP